MSLEVFVDSNLECFGTQGQITVCGCDGGDVEIECTLKPDGAADPTITDLGDGIYSVNPSVVGSYQFKVTCCGND